MPTSEHTFPYTKASWRIKAQVSLEWPVTSAGCYIATPTVFWRRDCTRCNVRCKTSRRWYQSFPITKNRWSRSNHPQLSLEPTRYYFPLYAFWLAISSQNLGGLRKALLWTGGSYNIVDYSLSPYVFMVGVPPWWKGQCSMECLFLWMWCSGCFLHQDVRWCCPLRHVSVQ